MNRIDQTHIRMAISVLEYYVDPHLSAIRENLCRVLEHETPAAQKPDQERLPDVEDWRFSQKVCAKSASKPALPHAATDLDILLKKLEGRCFKKAAEAVQYLVGEEGVDPAKIAAACEVPEFAVRALLNGKVVPGSTRKIKLKLNLF